MHEQLIIHIFNAQEVNEVRNPQDLKKKKIKNSNMEVVMIKIRKQTYPRYNLWHEEEEEKAVKTNLVVYKAIVKR